MLMEKRFQEILRILEEQGTVSVQDLTESLDASEATIRRDLSQLAQMGKLKKIYGGAASLETGYQTREIRVEEADRKVCGFPDRAGRLCLCGCRKQYGISGGVHRGT